MERCKFHLIQGDTRLEIEGPRDFVEGQLAAWRELFRVPGAPAKGGREAGADAAAPEPPARPIAVKSKITLQEFFKLKNPRTDADRVLVTAYFLEKYERKTSFDRQEVIEALGRVHSIPERLDGYIQDNLRKGFILESAELKDGEKPFSITYSGEMYVKGGLE